MTHPTFELDGKTFVILPQADLERLEDAARNALEERSDIAAARTGLVEMEARPDDMLTSEEALRRAEIGGVKFWRERRKMSAAAVADAAGISAGYLSEIETGKKPGGLKIMARISTILRVTINDLV